MCRNLIFFVRKAATKIPECVLETLVNSAVTNNDGFALFALTKNGTVYDRTLSLYKHIKLLFKLAEEDVMFLHVHQRAATAGQVNVDNVHLWKYGDVFFSHNGTVAKYATFGYSYYSAMFDTVVYKGLNDPESDSKKFFNNNAPLLEKYFKSGKVSEIKKLCQKDGLWGVVMLNSVRGEFIVLGVGKPVYLYTFNDFGIVSNTLVEGLSSAASCEVVKGRAGTDKLFYRKYRYAKVAVKNHQPTDWYLEYF